MWGPHAPAVYALRAVHLSVKLYTYGLLKKEEEESYEETRRDAGTLSHWLLRCGEGGASWTKHAPIKSALVA